MCEQLRKLAGWALYKWCVRSVQGNSPGVIYIIDVYAVLYESHQM